MKRAYLESPREPRVMNRLLFILVISITTLISSQAVAQWKTLQEADAKNEAKCNDGDGEACLRRSKNSDDKWIFQAATYLNAECEEGKAKSCVLSVEAHERMFPAPKNYDPKPQLEKACKAKLAEGCRKLADRYIKEKNDDAANTYALEACRLGDERTCEGLYGSAVFIRRLDPNEGARTYKMLVALCDLDKPEACIEVGKSLREGFGAKKDKAAAYKHFSKACKLGSKRGCAEEAGAILFGVGVKPNREKAHPILQKLCHSGEREQLACGLLGWSALASDTEEALALMKQSCAAGQGQVCHLLAVEYSHGKILPRDTKRATELFNEGCKSGYTQSCRVLAGILMDGEGVAKDVKRAVTLAKFACERSDALACYLYGDLHRTGEGLPKDPILAAAYYDKSCNLEATLACNEFAWLQCNDRNICTSKELEAIERALPLDKNGNYHDTHGLVLCKMGKTKEAKAAYKKACAKNKDLCKTTCPAK